MTTDTPITPTTTPTTHATTKERILVIRLGALGDIVLCFQAFHEIRCAHPEAEIALLTMPAYADLARSMPWFDRIILDERAPAWRPDQWLKLLREVRIFAPTRVYDLQGKARQTFLYMLLGGPRGSEWSGAAPFASHPRLWPPQPGMHFTDFLAAQLRKANVPVQTYPDLSWLEAPIDELNLPSRYIVLIPSCAKGREFKRWPLRYYAELAQRLYREGTDCVAIGSRADHGLVTTLRGHALHLKDMTGKTSFAQLASLMRRSVAVVGNDTGPTHLAAALGVPTLALFSDRVNPVWSAPKGTHAQWVQGSPMSMLSVDKVFLALKELLAHKA